MAEPPPRDPTDPADDETVIVPPDEPVDETIVRDEWGAETVVTRPVDDDAVLVEETETAPPRKPPTLWPWLLGLLILVLAGIGAFFLLSRDDDEPASTTTAATTQVQERTVPDVVGTTSSEATAALREAGFDVNLVSVPSDRPPGTVVAQSPAAGSGATEGTSIRLNVAVAPTGTTSTEATTTGATTTAPSTTAPTTTAPTTTAPTTTAPAPQPATVPDVVGDELADASRDFADEGLKVAVAYVPSQEAAGSVVAQAQAAGTELSRGSSVQLNVSTGADPEAEATVPRTTGSRLDGGRDQLEQAGFEVLALTVGEDGEVRNESTIVSQSPAGGASIPRGSLVLVYVGS
jgi:beta-lactam-binding protein with PASTA domain